MVLPYKSRADPQGKGILPPLGHGQQLNDKAELSAEIDVHYLQGVYTPYGNSIEVDGPGKGQCGENGELMGGISAGYVEGRVGFRETRSLGVPESILVGFSFANHFGKDEITGPVHNPVQRVYPVCRESARKGLDDGDTPGAGCLEGKRFPGPPGGVEDFRAVMGKEGFIGGDHMLARFEALQDYLPGNCRASYEFDDDIYRFVPEDFLQVFRNQIRIDSLVPGGCRTRPGYNGQEPEVETGSPGNFLPFTGELGDHCSSDGAAADNGYTDSTFVIHILSSGRADNRLS